MGHGNGTDPAPQSCIEATRISRREADSRGDPLRRSLVLAIHPGNERPLQIGSVIQIILGNVVHRVQFTPRTHLACAWARTSLSWTASACSQHPASTPTYQSARKCLLKSKGEASASPFRTAKVLQSGRGRHGWLSRAARTSIQRRDILGEATFRPIDQIETHARALLEGSKTLHLYGREMCEHIFSTFFWFNEAKPFDVVEPFHGSLSHLTPPEIPNV